MSKSNAAGYESISRYADEHRKLSSSDVGANAPRECTDTFCIVLFALIWVVMFIVAGVAVHNGDLDRLTSGTDYLGNVCGDGTPQHVTADVARTWKSRTSLFFPIRFDPLRDDFNIFEAIKFPICVEACPNGNADTRARVEAEMKAYGNPEPIDSSFTFRVQYDSTRRFGRCMPDFFSYDCTTAKCNATRSSAASTFSSRLGLDSTAQRSFAEVKEHWWVILVTSLITIVVSFVWLFILRRLVKPVVVVTLFLVLLFLCVLGGVFFHRYTLAKDEHPNSSSQRWFLAAAVISWIAAFLYVCVGLYLWKDIMVACDIIEEASKVPIQMPTIVAVPPVLVLFIIPVAIFSLFMAAEIYTSSKLEHELMPAIGTSGNITTGNSTSAHFVGENWRTYAQIFNLFVFLWSVGFIHAIGFMIVAFCAVFWYWSVPGDEKDPQQGVKDALAMTFRNHLGSLAFGSLIIAIIQTIRVIILGLERHMREYIDKNDAVKFLVCCMNCCLAYFERFVQFVNKNAYVVQCLTGESFLPAARHALQLLVRNALSVGAVNIIGEYVMLIGKVLITCLSLLIGYGIMSGVAKEEGSTPGLVVILIAIGIVSYFIACVFIAVFGVCIDTVLLSYCYDLEQNNGADRQYYCPDDLRKHVANAERRAKEQQLKHAQAGHTLNDNLN